MEIKFTSASDAVFNTVMAQRENAGAVVQGDQGTTMLHGQSHIRAWSMRRCVGVYYSVSGDQ